MKWLVALLLSAVISAQDAATTRRGLTRLEQAGQLLVPSVAAGKVLDSAEALSELETLVRSRAIGGVHCLRATAAQVHRLTQHLQRIAPIPLLITADCEGGAGIMFPGATRFPRGMALGAANSEVLTERIARRTAEESALIGVNVVLAPIADVNVSPQNPIINLRSYGDDPALVARHAAAFVRGVESVAVMAVAKHFPGHGDTHEDSHLGLPVVNGTRERLDTVELPPFLACIRAGARGVMSAHIALPQLTANDTLPATLSPLIINGLLRKDLGFSGIVFTDALDMGGITRRFSAAEAAVRAVGAGCDVLLFPTDIQGTAAALARAVENGELPPAVFNAAVERVLAARLKLVRGPTCALQDLAPRLDSALARSLALECAVKSVVRVRKGVLNPKLPVHVIVLRDQREDWGFDAVGPALMEPLRAHGMQVRLSECAGGQDLPRTEPAEQMLVLAAASLSPFAADDWNTFHQERQRLLAKAALFGHAIALLGNPYTFGNLRGHGALVVGLDWDAGTQQALAALLLDASREGGVLPAAIPGLMTQSSGVR